MHSLFKALLLGCIISILGVLSYTIAPGYDIEEKFGLDLLFSVRGQRTAPENVAIVAIDKIASDYYQLPNNPAKWPRKLHTQLIQYLQSEQAAIVVFDIFFKDAKDTVADQQLAAAIKKSNNVVLFAHLKRELLNQFGSAPRTEAAELFNIERLIYPTAIIAASPRALAPFALPKYPAKVSTFWTFRLPAGEIATTPVVALQLLLFTQDSFNNNLKILEQANKIKFPKQFIKNEKLNINLFISEMKEWIKQHKDVTKKITTGIKKGDYDSSFSSLDKVALLQFFDLYYNNNQRYLNFIGPPRSIKTFTYDAVLNNKTPDNYSFKNKIVFIGFSDRLQPEQIDNFNTVFSQKNGVDLSGVEIAATAFSNLYSQNSISSLDHISYLILIIIFGFIVAFTARLLSSITALLTLISFSFSYFGISYYLFSVYSIWLPIIIPLFLLIPVSLFSSISWQYIDTNKERNRIRKAFGFYLPDNIVNKLATENRSVQNSQDVMYGICMATDAEQYTALSENLTPGKLSLLVNNYYEVLFKPIRNNNGIISDVVGDAMLAIWTAHNPELKLRQSACYASIQIQAALHQQQLENKEFALQTRIGLHSGNIMMGNVGAVDHYEYRAVGDIVNTANRIQGLNKQLQTHIIASYETIQNIPDLELRELGRFKLSGKKNALHLFEILDFKSNKAEQTDLVTLYTTALNYFYSGELNESLVHFQQVTETYPSDGPTQFYIKYIKSLMDSNDYVKSSWAGIVTMTQK